MVIIMEKVFNIKENLRNDNCNSIEVKLIYNKDAGISYWDGHYKKRGYRLSMSPTERSNKYGYMTTSTVLGSGGYIMLREVSRKSKKVEQELLEELTDDKLREYVEKYLPEYIIE